MPIQVTATAPAGLAAIDEILGAYRPARLPSASAVIQVHLAGPGNVGPPPRGASLRCRSEDLAFWWHAASDEVWIDVHERGWVHVLPRQGMARAALDLDPAADGWVIAHHAFYPALLELLKERGLFPLHAGLVERDGQGLLLCGPSGSGKTTLTLELATRGWRLLGDDTCFLCLRASRVEALAFWEDLHVTDATIERFPSLSFLRTQTPRRSNWKRHFALRDLQALSLAERVVPRWVVFPRVAGTPTSSFTPLHGVAPALRMAPQSVLPIRPPVVEAHFAVIAQVADSVAAADLAMGTDLAETVQVLETFLTFMD